MQVIALDVVVFHSTVSLLLGTGHRRELNCFCCLLIFLLSSAALVPVAKEASCALLVC